MKIDFSGRGIDITDRIRTFTESKLERLKRLADDIQDVSVTLSVEKYRQKAEIKFHSAKSVFHGAEETSDMFGSIDSVVSKLESQLKKRKNKNTARKRATRESIRVNVLELPKEAEAEAPSDREIQVIPTEHSEIRPMALDEAVEELQQKKREFIFFRNSHNDLVNIVYHRRDGNIGLIETGA